MNSLDHFSENEIPYEILSGFGLTQEMIDDLPDDVMQRLLSARTTCILPIVIEDTEGRKLQTEARIFLVRKTDGSVDVGFVPVWKDKELCEYTELQQRQLLADNVIIAELADVGQSYVQYDKALRQTLTVPVSLVAHNLEIMADNAGLDAHDKSRLLEGKVVEIDVNGDKLSIGVDINDMSGCRVSKGDSQAWKEQARLEQLPEYNFGIYGCWVNDQIKNSLTYIPEEDYTPEMLLEQKRIGEQKAAAAHMRNFHR